MLVCGCFSFSVAPGFCQQAVRSLWEATKEPSTWNVLVCLWKCVGEMCRGQHGPCDPMLRTQACHWDILPLQSPRGFSGHRLNGSRGRGVGGGNRCSPWVVQSLSPSAFFFGGWAFTRPLTRLRATRSPKLCPVAMAPRLGLTSAHVPSQPKGSAPFVSELRREKEKEEEDGWRGACERTLARSLLFCNAAGVKSCGRKTTGESLFLVRWCRLIYSTTAYFPDLKNLHDDDHWK